MNQEIVQKFIEQYPQHLQTFQQFVRLHQKKLWNQLTVKILDFLYHPNVRSSCSFAFYTEFISKFQINIDQIKLLRIITFTNRNQTNSQRLAFYINLQKKGFLSEQPRLICKALQGIQYVTVDIKNCLKILDSIKRQIQDKKDIDEFVYSTYYRFAFSYFKQKLNYKQFYLNALQYLAYIAKNEIEQKEIINLSFQMGLSTLVSQDIYNFSELLQQPLLISLKNSQYAWTYKLLTIFNKGDIKQYQLIRNSQEILKNNILNSNKDILDNKISIMAFLQLLFNLPKNDRVVTFENIANVSGISQNQVESMIMKTMALGLLKGGIDQLKKVVIVSWIAPKVLQKDRVIIMQRKFEEWSQGINNLAKLLVEKAR